MAVSPILFVINFSTQKKLYNCSILIIFTIWGEGLFLPTLYYILRINPMFNISHTKEKLNNVFGIEHDSCHKKFFLKAYKT